MSSSNASQRAQIGVGGASHPPQKRRRRLRRQWRGTLVAIAFVAPALALYGLFAIFPLLQLVVMSFWHWNGITVHHAWAGLSNYAALVRDSRVRSALSHNLIWVLLAALPVVAGLVLAALLSSGRRTVRASSVYRVVFFLPYVLPIVVVAFIWRIIYDPSTGALNAGLSTIGLSALTQGWLGDPHLALVALIMAANWTGFGFCMMLFLAGMSAIDPSRYDAAALDGASALGQFWHVTLPGLANTLNVVVLVVFIATMRVFDLVFVTTNGSPAGRTEVLSTLVYRQTFADSDVGYGAATAVASTILIVALSAATFGMLERRLR